MAEAAPQPKDPFLGRHIAEKYVIESFIGGGSMGAVYRARQTALHRVVAIKVMYPELAQDREFVARFRREAHAASRLAHTNSITITDFGEESDGLLYLVMEFVDGPSLEDLIERGEPLPEERIVDIMSQILSALAAAHDAGIVHRDLKPANVLVVQKFDDDGFPVDYVKVCDFGVASLKDGAADGVVVRPSQDGMGAVSMAQAQGARRPPPRPAAKPLTMAGAVVGTPAYMSPEQATGRPQDARSDLYALGVVLYELLTRRLPFDGQTAEELMARHVAAIPVPPIDLVPCNIKLSDVAVRAMAKKPEDRFPNARAMRAEIRSIYTQSLTDMPTAYPPGSMRTGHGTASRLSMRTPGIGFAPSGLVPRESTLVPRFVPSDLPTAVPPSLDAAAASATGSGAAAGLATGTQSGVSTMQSAPTPQRKWPYAAVAGLLLAGGVVAFVSRSPATVATTQPAPVASSEVDTPPLPAIPSGTAAVAPEASALVASADPAPHASADTTTQKSGALAAATNPATNAATNGRPAGKSGGEPDVVPAPAAVVPVPAASVAPAPLAPVAPAITPATPVVPAAPATPAVVAPAFVPDHGRVRINVASSRMARAPVAQMAARLDVSNCYRDALRRIGHAEGGSGTVNLDIDENGVIEGAQPQLPGGLASASACIAGRIRGQRLATPPDTGAATAVLSLAFEP